MADKTGFPPVETMLEDLSKVEGLGSFWQMLAMVAKIQDAYGLGEIALTRYECDFVTAKAKENGPQFLGGSVMDNEGAVVTRQGVLAMQVCVPKSWTDEQAEEFANAENPTGIQSKWNMRHQGHECLAGQDARTQCAQRSDFVHIMLEC